MLLHTCTCALVYWDAADDSFSLMFGLFLYRPLQENEILTEQEELISLEQVLRRQIATEKEEIERLRAEIADIQR